MSGVKTGGMGTAWIDLSPKPPRVNDRYLYWSDQPSEQSARCTYWLEQLERGWVPNRHIRSNGYDSAAAWFGVYIWEYINIIGPVVYARWRELVDDTNALDPNEEANPQVR